jgi:hypothetical protein
MTHALHRFTAALTGWIPDISGIPARRQVTLGIAVSILLHVMAILLIALLLGGKVQRVDFAKPKIKPRGIELTILPPAPKPEPVMPFTLAAQPETPFIDSRGLDIAREAALNPIFESDENMRAASELPATGDAPLPSQQGRDRPFNAFKTQKSLLGSSVPRPFPPAQEVPPLSATPPVAPAPPMVAQQEPPPASSEPTEKAESKPPEKEEPRKAVATPRPDEIVMAKAATPALGTKIEPPPVATPAPAPIQPVATPRPVEQQAMLTTPAPRPPTARESGYQPHQEQNRIAGSISNRGKKSVDAIATPMGKFKKQVSNFIGSRWTYYVQNPPQPGLYSFGSTEIVFYITKDGRIEGVKVLSNTANRSYAEMCVAAISDARNNDPDRFRPPEGAVEAMRDGRLEYSLTFTYYSY